MLATDIELMLRARAGDVEAFGELVWRYRGPLRRFFGSVLADSTQADDCVQETFLRLWTSRARYEPTGSFAAYLFRIGRHYWLNQRKKYRPKLVELSDTSPSALAVSQPESIVLERLRQARIRRAVAALPGHYREVFELSHFAGLKYHAISERRGIPVGTVKSRMAGAVRRLRRELVEEGE
jgi:RNA polymerase sigma-70 factor (ECF subfamily)